MAAKTRIYQRQTFKANLAKRRPSTSHASKGFYVPKELLFWHGDGRLWKQDVDGDRYTLIELMDETGETSSSDTTGGNEFTGKPYADKTSSFDKTGEEPTEKMAEARAEEKKGKKRTSVRSLRKQLIKGKDIQDRL